MRQRLIDTLAPLFLPLWWLHLLQLRRRLPALPPASGPTRGSVPGPEEAIHLLVLGESTVAGVGAADHQQALTGQIARALAAQTRRTVHWEAVGQNGTTVRAATRRLLPRISAQKPQVVVVALGVNDVLWFRSRGRFMRDIASLERRLRRRIGPAPIVWSPIPDLGRFPSLSPTLRSVLGHRARRLDQAARDAARTLPQVIYLPPMPLPSNRPDLFCADGFHPSPLGYELWARYLVTELVTMF